MNHNIDAPKTDASNAVDSPNNVEDDAACPQLIHLSLRNCNHKISPNTNKKIKFYDPQH